MNEMLWKLLRSLEALARPAPVASPVHALLAEAREHLTTLEAQPLAAPAEAENEA